MKTIFYITGKQGSGKSRLANSLRNCRTFSEDVTEVKLKSEMPYKESLAITSQKYSTLTKLRLKKFCRENNYFFFDIKLK